jgi:uncharacterized phage-associated protein
MSVSAAKIANFFLTMGDRESVPITPLKLQKLVYFAHGWYLGLTGESLLAEPVQAWKYGPVVPTLYHEFKEFGNNPIKRRTHDFQPTDLSLPEMLAAKGLLERVWAVYSKYTAVQLSALSHETNGPWHQTVALMQDGNIQSAPIPTELIRAHFARQGNTFEGK